MLPARGDQVRQGRREAKGKARGRSISNKRRAKLLRSSWASTGPQRAVGVRSCGRGRAGRVRVRFGSSARLIQLYRGHRHWSERVCVVWPCRAGPERGPAPGSRGRRQRSGRVRDGNELLQPRDHNFHISDGDARERARPLHRVTAEHTPNTHIIPVGCRCRLLTLKLECHVL